MLHPGITNDLKAVGYYIGDISHVLFQCDPEMGHFCCAKEAQVTLRRGKKHVNTIKRIAPMLDTSHY